MAEIVISEHAHFEMEWRRIDELALRDVVHNPQQKLSAAKGRVICQSRYFERG